jgi:outer membrane lipoprotein carrier protein
MIKNTLILALAAMIGSASFAQKTDAELNPKDPKAQEILDALSEKATAFKSFKADFEYTLENKVEGINETQKGNVTMMGKDKYILKIAGQEIVSNGETVWTFIDDVKELQIAEMPEEDDQDGNLMNPANAFHLYKTGFKYMHEGTATVNGKTVDVIKMFPINPDKKRYHTIVLNIDKAKMELVSIEVKGKDGNTYTYLLKNFQSDIAITGAAFEFDENRADDIIDMRD